MDELNIEGLDMNDPSAIDQVDLDNLLTGDTSEEFNVADRELLNLIARDQMAPMPGDTASPAGGGYGQLNLGSNTSIDRLVQMPLGELGPSIDSINAEFQAQQSPGSLEPDPLMMASPMMNNQNRNNNSQMHNMMMAQQTQMNMPEPNPMMNQGMNQGMNQMMGQQALQQQLSPMQQSNNDNTIQRLEQEKMALLAKLNAINQQQDQLNTAPNNNNNNNMMGMQQQQQQQGGQMSQQQMLMMMQQMQQQQQQQQQPKMNMQSNQMASLLQQQQNLSQRGGASEQRKPSLNTAVSGLSVKDPGESPLTSFLRAKGGGGGGGSSGASALKTAGIKGTSASVFSKSGIASVDPFNKNRGKLSGAMDRSIQTQSMIKQLAMTNNAQGGRAGGGGGNAQWGAQGGGGSGKSQAYKYSGILPKHASDGHLLRKPNGRQGSKTKADLMYGGGLGRSRASHSKEALNKLKGSSGKLSNSALNRLDRKDSSSALPVRASRTSKYKFGVSGSMGNLGSFKNLGSFSNVQNPNLGGGGGGGQYQGNAQW